VQGCSSHNCVVRRPEKHGTNTGCFCPRWKVEKRIMELENLSRDLKEAVHLALAYEVFMDRDTARFLMEMDEKAKKELP
jgi:hypothetical protein